MYKNIFTHDNARHGQKMKLGDKLKQFRTWAVVQGGKFIQFKQIFSSNQMA